jgi:hypothetical protein
VTLGFVVHCSPRRVVAHDRYIQPNMQSLPTETPRCID